MGAEKYKKQAARTTAVGAKAKRVKVPFTEYRFVRIELNELEKHDFKSQLESGEFNEIPLDEWVERGYKLSVSRDDQGGGTLASITSIYTDNYDKGQILTARGRDAITALAVLTYKDRVICGEDGWLATEIRRGAGSSDIG